MNPADYQRVLGAAHSVRILARMIDVDELDEAIAAAQTADALGPVLDPTAYRERHHLLLQDERTMRAVREVAVLEAQARLRSQAAATSRREGPAAS